MANGRTVGGAAVLALFGLLANIGPELVKYGPELRVAEKAADVAGPLGKVVPRGGDAVPLPGGRHLPTIPEGTGAAADEAPSWPKAEPLSLPDWFPRDAPPLPSVDDHTTPDWTARFANELGDAFALYERNAGETVRVVGLNPALTVQPFARVVRPRLITAVPEDAAEYRSVYGPGSLFLGGEERQVAAYRARYAHRTDVARATSIQMLADQIRAYSDSLPVVIVGHSEQRGRLLVLPSGERVAVEEIHEVCLTVGTQCVVLTCYGGDFGLTTEISSLEAMNMWETAVAYQASHPATMTDVVSVMRFDLRTRRAARTITISSVTAAGGTGGVAVTLHYRNDE